MVLDRWELGHAVDRGGDRDRRAARVLARASSVGEIPARLLTDECPRYDVAASRAAAHARSARSSIRPHVADALLAAARARRTSAAASSSSAATTSSSARARCAVRGSTRPSCASAPRSAASRSRSTGRGASLGSTPSLGGALAVLEAARNVACAGGEPLGFTDCLNFGNPEKPEIGWELAEAIDGMAAACEALGAPDRLGQRLALQRDERPRDPPDAGRRRGRARRGRPARARRAGGRATRCFSPRRSPLSLAGSEYQARFGEIGGTPAPLDLDAEARLVSFLWRAAPLCSLVHDASEGGSRGLPRGGGDLLRAAARSLDLADDPPSSSARSADARCWRARPRRADDDPPPRCGELGVSAAQASALAGGRYAVRGGARRSCEAPGRSGEH